MGSGGYGTLLLSTISTIYGSIVVNLSRRLLLVGGEESCPSIESLINWLLEHDERAGLDAELSDDSDDVLLTDDSSSDHDHVFREDLPDDEVCLKCFFRFRQYWKIFLILFMNLYVMLEILCASVFTYLLCIVLHCILVFMSTPQCQRCFVFISSSRICILFSVHCVVFAMSVMGIGGLLSGF